MASYRELEVWKKARILASHTYTVTGGFPRTQVFGLTQQMRRASVSIVCNIAEGHGRRSSADRVHFFLIGRGSLLELETQVLIAGDLEFMPSEAAEECTNGSNEVLRLLNGLIRYYVERARREKPEKKSRKGREIDEAAPADP